MKTFISLKNTLISEQTVDYLKKPRYYSLILNASTGTGKINGGFGAMLCKTDEEGEERVIVYAGRQLLKHKKCYFLVEKHVMIWAVDHFDSYMRPN
jgi:hypothetical protein